MEPALRLGVDILQLALLLGLPGLCVLLLLPRPPTTVAPALVLAATSSMLYTIVAAAALLHFGLFSTSGLLMASALPLTPVLIWGRRSWLRLRQIRLSLRTLMPVLVVGAAVLLALLVGPRWNFLIAPNMDAGNYEVYGNHFWTTGSLYLDGAEVVSRGGLPEWLRSHNTWDIDERSGIGRPLYFPAYPILLGVVKATFDTALASPLANAIVASLVAMTLVLVALALGASRLQAILVVLAVCMTPVFFLYGKHLMAEQLGLLAMSLIAYSFLSGRDHEAGNDGLATSAGSLSLSVGLGLGLLAKIDFLPVLPFLVIGLAFREADNWSLNRARTSPRFFLGPALATIGATATVSWLVSPSYLHQARPRVLSDLITPAQFLLLLGLTVAAALALMPKARTALDRVERKGRRELAERLIGACGVALAVLWVAFIAWNLLLRSHTGPSPRPHDAENLIRLFSVTSPFLLMAALLISPFALARRASPRSLVAVLVLGLGSLLFASHHTAPDFWWMRRYLAFFVPLVVVVLAASLNWWRRLHWSRTMYHRLATAVLVVLVFTQAWNVRPLLQIEINPDVPRRLSQLAREIPDDALVVAIQGHRLVRGIANTYRSLTDLTVLVDVHIDDIDTALALARDGQAVAVLAPYSLPGDVVVRLGLTEGRVRRIVEAQWADWLADFYDNPRPTQSVPYLIYRRVAARSEA